MNCPHKKEKTPVAAQWLLTCSDFSRKVYKRREERPIWEDEEEHALCRESKTQPNGAF